MANSQPESEGELTTAKFFDNAFRGRRPKFDDKRKLAFLKRLAQTGSIVSSAAVVGVYGQTVHDAAKVDEEFAEAMEQAQHLHNDHIDDSIRERGIEGLPASKFHAGEWFTSETVREFSDQMAALYAKRRNPAYRDKITVDGLQNSGVLIVPATVKDPQEWAKQFEKAPDAPAPEGG